MFAGELASARHAKKKWQKKRLCREGKKKELNVIKFIVCALAMRAQTALLIHSLLSFSLAQFSMLIFGHTQDNNFALSTTKQLC